MNNRDSSRGKETPNLSSGEKNRYNDARCKGLRQKPIAGKFIVVIGVDLPADSQQRDGNSAPAEYKRGSIGSEKARCRTVEGIPAVRLTRRGALDGEATAANDSGVCTPQAPCTCQDVEASVIVFTISIRSWIHAMLHSRR
ncbi:hypothetical protein HN011_007200 [Eciton burchellii]|nr:hypothetical protein HN011_007200 [Eciton burchellii]